MTIFRAQITLPFFTNIPKDVITNTLYFEGPDLMDTSAASGLLTPIIKTFYDSIYDAGGAIAPYVGWANARIRWYDMSDPEPRVPFIVNPGFSFSSTTSDTPTEVAVVLSFHAEPVSGIPMARRRGRIYLGGISPAWLSNATGAVFTAVEPAAIANLVSAAGTFRAAVEATSLAWVVWSPTTQTASEVVGGWVDNMPDTQRRRSVDSTARTLWT